MSDVSTSKNVSESALADIHTWHGLKGLQRHVSDVLDEMYERIGKHHHGVSGPIADRAHPETELSESDIGFEFTMKVPGLSKSDLDVAVRDGRLIITGEKKVNRKSDRKQRLVQECFYGRFERSFWLSDYLDIDHIEASLKNGVLHVSVPWREGKAPSTKRVPIKGI